MKNLELRDAIKKSRVFHYEIAEAMGMSEVAFSKLLRTELSADKKEQVMSVVDKLRGEEV